MAQTCVKVFVASLVMLGPVAGELCAQEKLDPQRLAARIDQRLEEKWDKAVTPAPRADDAEFLRRLYLDLVGRIPRVSEVREFLDDPSPDKRRRAVEELLKHPQHIAHFGTTLQNLILPPANNQQFRFFAVGFKTWLEGELQKDTPYDQMVRAIITASTNQPGGMGRQAFVQQQQGASPFAFIQANEQKPENLAASASRIFLGVKLECAQCHDHPFARWSRDQFWEMAAFFSTVQPNQRFVQGQGVQQVAFKPREIKIPGTDKVVKARFLDGQDPAWKEGTDPRVILADWITSPKNPYFARTTVNRVWGHLLGVGIIDPVDDEPTEENPISHPELLAELAEQFVAHNYDLKYLIRAITATRAYQRTSAQSHPSQAEARVFARMPVRGMTPEQLFDSLALAAGYRETAVQPNRFAVLPGLNNARGDFLNRFAGQERATEKQTSILQALALMNGKFVADATSLERSSTLAAVADAPFLTTPQKIETLYLAALSRLPRPAEMERLLTYVNQGGARNDPRTALADVFWVLLNSSEFVLNH